MYNSRNTKSNFGTRNGSSSFKSRGYGVKKYGSASNSNSGGNRSRRPRGEHIDISKFIKRSVPKENAQSFQAKHTFLDFGFTKELQTNLEKRHYVAPTPIQDEAILPILNNRDLIGLADTGTGKTAAFLLPLINKIANNRDQKVLIIAPTRELAIQIDKEFQDFSLGMRFYSAVCVGGVHIGKQIYNLKRNPNFIVGTPGRLKDLSERKLIRFENFQNIVLDEVDRMLDMGFVDEITTILNALPEKRQALFFSATLPSKIQTLVNQFLNDPVTIEVKTGDTAANVLQDIVQVRDRSKKFSELKNVLVRPEVTKVLIFTETKRDVEKLATTLTESGFRAESIHGNKRQHQRQKSLTAFRNDYCKILVATDVAARGLDIGDISHVINYTIPQTYNDYIHRIGRTGRGSKSGQALTFVE